MNVFLIITLIILFALIVIMPTIAIKAYRYGLSDCSKLLKNKEIIEETIKEVAREPTEEEIIARNIENYCGDGKGQVDLEDSGRNIQAI